MSAQGKLIKLTYYAEKQRVNFYLQLPSPTFAVLKQEISLVLFQERNMTPTEIKVYWIDSDNDEIQIVNQADYEVFLTAQPTHRHLRVAPLKDNVDNFPSSGARAATTEPDSQSSVTHERVICDICSAEPIVGFRYKCLQCPDFDLCGRCEAQHKHAEHMMIRLPEPRCAKIVNFMMSAAGRNTFCTRSRRERGSKVYCPFLPGATVTTGQSGEGDCTAGIGATSGAETSGTEHQRRSRRHHRPHLNLMSNLYTMMQDLAEGGAKYRTGANATTAEVQNACNEAAKAAQDAAQAAAKAAAEAAAQASANINETAAKAAADATSQLACDFSAMFGMPPAPPSTAETEEPTRKDAYVNKATPQTASTATETTNSEKDQNKTTEKQNEPTTNTAPNQTNGTSSLPSTPSLEDITKFIDPKLMQAGLQIFNNFSEMFAKMIDPLEGEGLSCPFQTATPPDSSTRKSSTTSSSSSMSFAPSTSAAAATAAATATQTTNVVNEQPMEKEKYKMPKQTESMDDVSVEATTSTTTLNIEQTPVPQAEGIRERSNSAEGDWQMIDKNVSAESFADLANTSSSETSVGTSAEGVAAPSDNAAQATSMRSPSLISVGSNTSGGNVYAAVSQDLRNHIERERRQEEQNNQQSTSEPTAPGPVERSSSNANAESNREAQPVIVEERPIVYHSNDRINNAVHAMMAMGFSNEGAWLTQLLDNVNGNISEALDLMTVAQRPK